MCSVHWGCSVHRGKGGGVQYIRGYLSTSGDTMSTSGDTMSSSGDTTSTSGDVLYIGVFNRNLKDFMNLLPPQGAHGIPRSTEHPSV